MTLLQSYTFFLRLLRLTKAISITIGCFWNKKLVVNEIMSRFAKTSVNKNRQVMISITLNNLWKFIQSMSLSASNELWLAEKLHESAIKKQQATQNKEYNVVEDTPKMVSEPLFGPASEEEATRRVEEAEKEYVQNQTAMTLEDFAEELKAEQLW